MSDVVPIQIKPEMKIRVLDDQALKTIHEATLTILKETGVRFPLERALKVFADAGAMVDFESQIVKIPPDLLMDSIENAPRTFTMASRGDPALDLLLDGTKTYFGTDGTGTTTMDLDTRKRRASTKKDVAMTALISDYLPSIGFYWPSVSAQDVPPPVIPLHELEASFTNTEKHVHIISCAEEETARYAVEMAIVIAGDRERAEKRPPLSIAMAAVSPLKQDERGLKAVLTFAEAGLPVVFGTEPIIGSTAPASITGTMVMGNAEILSGLCLIQLMYPGTPVCYTFFPEMGNPYTGEILGSSLPKHVFDAGVVELGHSYNLPVMTYYGATNSHEPGTWRTGKDNAIDALLVCLTGPELLPSMGLLEAYTFLYPEKILFDYEICESVKAMVEGIQVDAKTLALDEIMAVGPGGHFLDRDYTCENLRKLWQPGIAHQWSPKQSEFRDPQEVAVEKVRWILQNHKPKPLDDKVTKELRRIIKAAEKHLVR
jgi:trimethylamine--corrinoid protein Co-methyltransferase